MRIPFQDTSQGLGVTSADVVIKSVKIPVNHLFCLQRIAVTNETNNSAVATVGVRIGSNVVYFDTVTITTAGLYYAITDPIYIMGCKELIVKFTNTTDSDILKANFFGYYES